MLSGFKQLPLVSKIIFSISLIILFAWVIPTMVNYFKNVQLQEAKIVELEKVASKYNVSIKDTKRFNKESLIQYALNNVSNASIQALDNKSYLLKLELDKDKLENFNRFLETLSLHYFLKVNTPLTFKEKDKQIEVTMTIQEI
jgi:hypothetical protein